MRTKEEAIAYSESIGGLTSLEEKNGIWDLCEKYIPQGGRALSVGSWTGGSDVLIGEVCAQRGARLICIDAFSADMHSASPGIEASAFASVVRNTRGLPINFMAGNSPDFLDDIKDENYDFIFVDGDHHYPVVEQDLLGYWKKVKSGGCFLAHDWSNPCDVKDVFDKHFSQYELNHIDSAVWIEKP